MATPPPEDNEDNNPEWMGKYEGPPDFSTTYDQRPKRNPHATAMAALRDKLTEARHLYEQAIVEANAGRVAYFKAEEAWEDIAFPRDSNGRRRGGSARSPDHLKQMNKERSAKSDKVFELREQVQLWRVRISLLDRSHMRGEASECPFCGQAAAVLFYEKNEDVRECLLCQRTQVRTVDRLKWTPHEFEIEVKWERKERTKYYYL